MLLYHKILKNGTPLIITIISVIGKVSRSKDADGMVNCKTSSHFASFECNLISVYTVFVDLYVRIPFHALVY